MKQKKTNRQIRTFTYMFLDSPFLTQNDNKSDCMM